MVSPFLCIFVLRKRHSKKEKEAFIMGRGVHFHHKRKGHEQEKPKHGANVPSKNTERVEFAIEPAASEGKRPVSTKVEKDL
jgi:hypothetical protein